MKHIVRDCFAIIIMLATLSSSAHAASYICKVVGNEWTSFSRHIVGSIDYLVVGPPGRTFEAGTGVFVMSRPRGNRENGSGTLRLSAIGAGSLYIRQQDNGEPFKVCATSESADPITILKAEFN